MDQLQLHEEALDSQETLIDPAERHQPAAIFYFNTDNFSNATITRKDTRQVAYEIRTSRGNMRTTFAIPGEEGEIAIWERRDLLPDKIRLRDKPPVKLKSWLRYGGLFKFNFTATFVEQGREYIWQLNPLGYLSLYTGTSETPSGAPLTAIAWYQPSKFRVVNGNVLLDKGFLSMQQNALDIQDIVLLTFAILQIKLGLSNRLGHAVGGGRLAGYSF